MRENKRSSTNDVEDIDNKLKQYMLINTQISRTLTTQRVEISNLKTALRISKAELIQLRMECHRWSTKCETITKMYMAQIETVTKLIQSNAESFVNLSAATLVDSCNVLVDQAVAEPQTVPRNNDDSRRVSKSFELTKNQSQRRKDESYDYMRTIEEEDENGVSAEVSAELSVSIDSNGNDTVNDNSNVDEDSRDSLDDVLKSPLPQNGPEIFEDSQLSEEESSNIDEVTCMGGEESGGSDEEKSAIDDESGSSDEEKSAIDDESGESEVESSEEESDENEEESGESDEESGESDEESGEGDEESGEGDEESGRSVEAHDATNAERGTRDPESDVSQEAIVANVVTVEKNKVVSDTESSSEEESEETSAAENNNSIDQTSILTVNDYSTIRNDLSDKENDAANDSPYKPSDSKSTKSAISRYSKTSKKSTPAKSSRKLPTNNNKGYVQDQSTSLAYRSMEEKNLVSSTPYRNSSDTSSDDTATTVQSSRSSKSSTSISMASQASTSNSVASSRPKRKAAPVDLLEPKLNTKLRRPR